MKLVQLNIWQGKIAIAVERFLKQQDADIVCLQEVFSSDLFVPALDNLSVLEILQKELNYPHVYFEPTYSFSINGINTRFGNAILSKFPLQDRRCVFTSGEYHFVENWRHHIDHYHGNTRNALICNVQSPAGNFSLVNHHAFWAATELGNEQSVGAMQKLVTEIRDIKEPLIVSGDLNVSTESPVMRLFDGWLEDLTAAHDLNDTLTEFGKVRNVACDHILISRDVSVASFQKSPAVVSDHSPLILDFNI